MSENNSKSESLESLKKELFDMHKQFDNINIEKTLGTNEDPKEDSITIKKEKIEAPKKLIPEKEVISEVEKEPIIKSKSKNANAKNKESYLSIKDKLEKIKEEIKQKETTLKKQVITTEKIKSKPVTVIKNKPNIGSTKNSEIIDIADSKKMTSNVLTIVILVLIIIVLIGTYFIVF